MNDYQLINPLDNYYFTAPDDKIADAVAGLLGNMIGWERNNPDGTTTRGGLFAFQPTGIEPTAKTVMQRRQEVAAALRTIEIKRNDRIKLGVDPDKWHDHDRTSLNDIRAYALQLADNL